MNKINIHAFLKPSSSNKFSLVYLPLYISNTESDKNILQSLPLRFKFYFWSYRKHMRTLEAFAPKTMAAKVHCWNGIMGWKKKNPKKQNKTNRKRNRKSISISLSLPLYLLEIQFENYPPFFLNMFCTANKKKNHSDVWCEPFFLSLIQSWTETNYNSMNHKLCKNSLQIRIPLTVQPMKGENQNPSK